MEVLTVKVPETASRTTVYKLTPIGDVHLGARGCDEQAFIDTVKMVADDPLHYTVLMGDMADCILPDDARFDAEDVAEWLWQPKYRSRIVDAQYDRLYTILKTIPPNRILGALRGNHEAKIRTKHYRDLTLDLCRSLGIPYLEEQAFIRLQFGRRGGTRASYDIYVFHGSSSGRKAGAKINLIQDVGGFIDADIIMQGHVHDKLVSTDARLGLNAAGNFTKRERFYVITGTFLKTYELGTAGYGARANYRPTSIGAVTLELAPFATTPYVRARL